MLIDFEDHESSSGLENDLTDYSFDVRLLIPRPRSSTLFSTFDMSPLQPPTSWAANRTATSVSYLAALSHKPIGKMRNRVLSNKASSSRGVKLGLRNNDVCPLGYLQGHPAPCRTQICLRMMMYGVLLPARRGGHNIGAPSRCMGEGPMKLNNTELHNRPSLCYGNGTGLHSAAVPRCINSRWLGSGPPE